MLHTMPRTRTGIKGIRPGANKDKNKNNGITDILNVATWNVQGLGNNETELNNILKEYKINIATITETKKKLKGTKELEDYVMLHSGVDQTRRACCGVAVLIDRRWQDKIREYNFISERIMTVRLKFDRGYLTVISTYAPEERKHDEMERYYKELQKYVAKANNDYVLLMGDLNARVGKDPIPGLIGIFGEEQQNQNGTHLREFVTFNELKITNTFFRKKEVSKFIWFARGYRSLTDYVVVDQKLSLRVIDIHLSLIHI